MFFLLITSQLFSAQAPFHCIFAFQFTFTFRLIASYIFLLSVLRVSKDINQATLSNLAMLEFHFPKDDWLMQGHILLTRHYHTDGYDGYGFNKRGVSSGWDVCYYVQMSVVTLSPKRIWMLDCYLLWVYKDLRKITFSNTPMSCLVFLDIIGHFSSSTILLAAKKYNEWGRWRKKHSDAQQQTVDYVDDTTFECSGLNRTLLMELSL